MGWGMFDGENTYENPFNFISERFKTRPIESPNKGEGDNLLMINGLEEMLVYLVG